MKKLIIIFSLLFVSSNFSYSNIYRTFSSGDWNSNSTWEASPDGGIHWCVLPGCIIDSVFYFFPIPNSANSDEIKILSGHNVTVSTNTDIDNMTIQNGGTISINTGIVLNVKYSGSYDFTLKSGGAISGTGTLVINGAFPIYVNMESDADFNVDLKIESDVYWINSSSSDTSVLRKNLVIDPACNLVIYVGTSVRVKGDIINNGIINSAGIGPMPFFIMEGNNIINNGNIWPVTLQFDGNTTLSGNGIYGDGIFSSASVIINPSKSITLANNVSFGLGGTSMHVYGTINPNSHVFTVHSSGGATVNIYENANVSNSGIFQSLGILNLVILPGANFNCPLRLSTGTTGIYCQVSPFIAVLKQSVTIDPGATLEAGGFGNIVEVIGNVINEGTISGISSRFRMKGGSLINDGTIGINHLDFDSSTLVSGSGSFTAVVNINDTKNMTLASNVTFNTTGFHIYGSFNPNSKIFTLTSGTLYLYSTSILSNSGIFQTQNNVNFNMEAGSIFNCPLKVNTGTTNVNSFNLFDQIFNRSITIDSGATLNVGAVALRAFDNVTNNGNISGSFNSFKFSGVNFINNNIVDIANFYFEPGIHNLSGTGNFTTPNLFISDSAIVTMQSNHNVHNINVITGGTFNLNSKKLQVTGYNPIVNNGMFNTTASTVEYIGASAQQISASNIIYSSLTINNSYGTNAMSDFSVNDTLSLFSGDIELNGYVITLSPSATLIETPGNTVKGTSGYITTTRSINAPSGFNVGGLGAVLTSSANLGSTEIRRSHNVGILSENESVQRHFDIIATNNSNLNATLTYRYDESELDTLQEASLGLYRSTNSGLNYTYNGGTVDTANNQITLYGINSFSRWSAGVSLKPVNIVLIIEGLYNVSTNKLSVRDTVTAYFANSIPPFDLIDSARTVIDSLTFTGSFLFRNAPYGTYYIVIRHRNGLETWSKENGEQYNTGTVLNYDFTSAQSQAFGNNLKLISSHWCIFSGDVTGEGTIDLNDVLIIYNDAANFTIGYNASDINGDGIVDLSDLLIANNNSNNFVHVVKP